ncbi:MAG: hypothetical protein AB1721_02400 [Patescibacteria group bacterium]
MLVRSRIKPYLIFFGLIVLVAGGAYFWGLRSSMLKLEKQAEQSLVKAEKYESLAVKLNQEKNRCLEFLAKEEGNFAEFSYCQKLVEFIKQLDISLNNN